ncbi:hypothetical protein PG990_012283 [Apiospora arundinis]
MPETAPSPDLIYSQDLKKLFADFEKNADKLTELDGAIRGLRETLQSVDRTQDHSIGDQALAQIRNVLYIGHEALCEVVQDRILRGVKGGFDDLHYRYHNVERPFGDTFEWIFDLDDPSPAASKFTEWLSSGDGIFHICGKLGSGKSTLMKKLYGHSRTRTELEIWARNFFFYALGTDSRQKSLNGLLRTLIYHILEERPILTKDILPAQWTKALSQSNVRSTFVIQDDEIEEAFERLASPRENDVLSQYCFSFFIDGLDEYQVTRSADRSDLVDRLLNLTNSQPDTFKLCVSSREENPFMDAFSESNRLYLHELTKSDIGKYVEARLQHIGNSQEHQKLVSLITNKAEGVFLWVVLVVQEIRKRSDDGASFPNLLKEIESLPNDMNQLLQRVLDIINQNDPIHFSYVVIILQFLKGLHDRSKSTLQFDLEDFSFLENYEVDSRFAQSSQFPSGDIMTAPERQTSTRKRLRGWKARIEDPPNGLEILSQLKLASLKKYWWEASQSLIPETLTELTEETLYLDEQAAMLDGLIEQRHKMDLDAPPYEFLRIFDTIPGMSLNEYFDRAFFDGTARFHFYHYDHRRGIKIFEIANISCVRHERFPFGSEIMDEMVVHNLRGNARTMGSTIRPIMSPLFTELFLQREGYTMWRLENTEVPVEADELAVLVYYVIGDTLTRGSPSSHRILHRLFEGRLISPSLPTHLSFGIDFAILHTADPGRMLSIWQHFVCWWITVIATHDDFGEPKRVMSKSDEAEKSFYYGEVNRVYEILGLFMTSGAELRSLLKIEVAEQTLNSFGTWVNFDVEIVAGSGEVIKLVTALDLDMSISHRRYSSRFPRAWHKKPPADKTSWSEALALPKSHMSLRDWIERSDQPNKQGIVELMDKHMRVKEQQEAGFGEPEAG